VYPPPLWSYDSLNLHLLIYEALASMRGIVGKEKPSFIFPTKQSISALRDVTRTRVALVQTRTQAKNRAHTVLEDTHSKRSSVVTDLCGKSGRKMPAALIAGERDPQRLSALALGRLRRKQLQHDLESKRRRCADR
jgi:hypothetical protein